MNELVKFTSFEKEIELNRLIGAKIGDAALPTIVAFGGIHGNERAGVHALLDVFKILDAKPEMKLRGSFYGVSGNLNALQNNIRFDKVDLNRIWTQENINELNTLENLSIEEKEQYEILKIIKQILKKHKGKIYFIDLHTTSSSTQPFITISDSLNNRKFSSQFNIPTILGIEEFLEGPLLTFMNEYGHMALGFEAGQHQEKSSITNCTAFLWQSLVISGCLEASGVLPICDYNACLSKFKLKQEFFKIDYKYTIKPFEDFKMMKGFKNFEDIHKNILLAYSNGNPLYSNIAGKIFMPLYQKKGDDGYFIINTITKKWLLFSKFLRKLKADQVLRVLPGIKKSKENNYTLIVNPKIAVFLATDIFHLFGYRKKVLKNDKMHFIKRDRKVIDLP